MKSYSPGDWGRPTLSNTEANPLGEPVAGNASLVQCSVSLGHKMFPWP